MNWHANTASHCITFNRRTPFELNTAVRCALLILYQTLSFVSNLYVVCIASSLMTCFMIYTKAFFKDIQSLFFQLDCLSKHKDSAPVERNNTDSQEISFVPQQEYVETLMLGHFKEVVDLLQKVTGWVTHRIPPNPPIIHIISILDFCVA